MSMFHHTDPMQAFSVLIRSAGESRMVHMYPNSFQLAAWMSHKGCIFQKSFVLLPCTGCCQGFVHVRLLSDVQLVLGEKIHLSMDSFSATRTGLFLQYFHFCFNKRQHPCRDFLSNLLPRVHCSSHIMVSFQRCYELEMNIFFVLRACACTVDLHAMQHLPLQWLLEILVWKTRTIFTQDGTRTIGSFSWKKFHLQHTVFIANETNLHGSGLIHPLLLPG